MPDTPALAQLDHSVAQQCMHCGLCLPHCPTFRETGMERNSPRGRIALMRAVGRGELAVEQAFGDEMYFCLGCLACQSACPADVAYAELFETARADIESARVLTSPRRRFYRWLALDLIFQHPRLLRAVARAIAWAQQSGLDAWARNAGLVPPHLRSLEPQAPRVDLPFSDERIAKLEHPPPFPATGHAETRKRVGLLTGCVQDIAYAGVNRDTADVLLANQCEVLTPRAQGCCGSLHAHNGDLDGARRRARNIIDAFDPLEDLDAVITNAGGCGSHLKHFGPLLKDDPDYAARARLWDEKARDIHEFLRQINFRHPGRINGNPDTPAKLTAYHPSCHLHHGQRVTDAPLEILNTIPGVKPVPLADADTCCGSAGIYSITHPEQSAKLLDQKINHIIASTATIVATANPGCDLQILNGLRARGLQHNIRVAHPVTLLAEAYRANPEATDPSTPG